MFVFAVEVEHSVIARFGFLRVGALVHDEGESLWYGLECLMNFDVKNIRIDSTEHFKLAHVATSSGVNGRSFFVVGVDTFVWWVAGAV